MNLIEHLKSLRDEREVHTRAIADIDAQLRQAREMLGIDVVQPAAAAPVPPVEPFVVRRCERCSEPFTPNAGVSGRFCSRRCYEGMPADNRRLLILDALKSGPRFVADLGDVAKQAGCARGSLHNDMQALRREGKVISSEAGWTLVSAEHVPPSQESAVPEPPEDPFVQPPTSLN